MRIRRISLDSLPKNSASSSLPTIDNESSGASSVIHPEVTPSVWVLSLELDMVAEDGGLDSCPARVLRVGSQMMCARYGRHIANQPGSNTAKSASRWHHRPEPQIPSLFYG